MKRQAIKYTALFLLTMAILQPALADPAQPPPPPPPEPPTGIVSNTFDPVTTIKSCNADFNSNTNTLEYCNEPYRQTKTKSIYFCDTNGNGQLDSGDNSGSWTNPKPSCGSGNSYVLQDTKQRTYFTCGKNDAEEVQGGTSVTKDVNKTTQVSDDWFCPSAKALSKRHSPGNLDAGIGISGAGYANLNDLSYRSDSEMSYNVLAAVPACVNRVPMIKADVNMQDDYSGTQTSKTGIYANHMNLYYGPGGSKGSLKEVNIPGQNQFKRQYDVGVQSDSYRMWAWRQRFAGAVQSSVQEQNLQLPEDVSVDDIAQEYRDQGRSVGDLWLSSDFLYGAEAGDPTTREVVIEREINSTCTQDVTQISERNFQTSQEFIDYAQNNEDDAIDILGKSGGNYCNLGQNDTLTKIRGLEKTGSVEQVSETLTGTMSTKGLDNITEDIDGEVNVDDIDGTFLNNSGDEEEITTARDFIYYYGADSSGAQTDLINSKSDWQNTPSLDDRTIGSIKDVSRVQTSSQISSELNLSNLEVSYFNDSGDNVEVNTSEQFIEYLSYNEISAKAEIENSRSLWQPSSIQNDEILSIDNVKDKEPGITSSTVIEFDVETRDNKKILFTAATERWMTGSEFGQLSQDELYNQMEDNLLPSNNSVEEIMNPDSRFDGNMIEIDGVESNQNSDTYEGQLTVKTVENKESSTVYIYNTFIEEELEKNSWNWRALQGVTMTTLSKCMYNWEDCMNNQRDLSGESWSGAEVFDTGYGPWEKTNTFSWSQTAAQEKGETLQDLVDSSDFYDQNLDVSFDKYYDGARGSSTTSEVPINVYRSCESDQGWTSEEGEFYHDSHFLCPDSSESNEPGIASTSTVYRCGTNPAQVPAEQSDYIDGRKVGGDWFVCKNGDNIQSGSNKWIEDKEKPNIYVQKFEKADNSTYASVSCQDDVATCDDDKQRMKIYSPGNQPEDCPEDYSEYNEQTGLKEIEDKRYVCAAGKDKVNKEGFTNSPVGIEPAGSGSIGTTASLEYKSSVIKIPEGESNRIFHRVENNADEYRDISVELGGVNSSFLDGSEVKTFTLVPEQTRDLEIQIEPQTSGERTFYVETRDDTVGVQLNDSVKVLTPNASQIGGLDQGADSEEVPGIGLIHLALLMVLSTLFIAYRD